MKKHLAAIVLLSLVVVMAEAAVTSFPAPGGWPSGLAYDGTSLYFYNAIGFRTIYQIDPNNGTVQGSFSGQGTIGGIEFDGVDRLFVTDFFNVGGTVREMALYESGNLHTIFSTFQVPFRANSVAFDGSNLYLHDWDSGRFLVTTRAGAVVADLNTGLRITDMVFDPDTGNIWALHIFSSKISEITTSGVELRRCETGRFLGGHALGAVTLVGSDLYIAEPNPVTNVGNIFTLNKSTLLCDGEQGVGIDIKPDGVPNSINPNSNGKITVAILSTVDFDASTQLNKPTLTFGRTGGEPSLFKCNKGAEDVNGDGFVDQICHFATQLAGFEAGDSAGVLRGYTVGGTPIIGTDAITIVGR